ncbi:MAG: PaaI family thioesterase [Spongiibacteraceae bacterium]
MSNDLIQHVSAAITSRDMTGLINKIPYANLLGIESLSIGEEFIFKLPKNDDNLGNPRLPAIHGGVMGGFLETAAALYVMMHADVIKVPKVIDFSIDYIRPGRHTDSFARCNIVRQGRNIANVSITAWQAQEDKPIATARAHFLLC